MKKILYLLFHYPQTTETYIKTEIEAVRDRYELRIVANGMASDPYTNHFPFILAPDNLNQLAEVIREFKPDVLHSHWFMSNVGLLSRITGVPFTLRSHSFDTSWRGAMPGYFASMIPDVNSDRCLGVLAFPHIHQKLIGHGIRAEKLVASYPVVDIPRFHNREPNGRAVMTIGAFVPKKQMEDALRIAKWMTDHPGTVPREFNLWVLEYGVEALWKLNEEMGRPAHPQPRAEPEEMPAIYKRHEWLLFTANRELNSVGWPLCIAEAQASGVGVLLPDLRPDLHQYAGPSGYFYNTLEEAAEILAGPYPEEKRLAAFDYCQQWDFQRHVNQLTDLWDRA
ncbi:MAG TPA: glycosyltransferase [Candidatus Kapabacteria bacterium]|nr:glycosyltransferase [Candidatus Kapabacteria bacterium]